MQVFFILFSVYFAVYQYINSKCLYRTHVFLRFLPSATSLSPQTKSGCLTQHVRQPLVSFDSREVPALLTAFMLLDGSPCASCALLLSA